ncbi:hypothetical protein Halhy_2224 [Haliscomenobacter hydrossis DSM 1100]|uniref:Uncharacterized protein n=1 Tax=Haliscomenobacter hydrossis (strain ATCC 27775 / DSM 1100 / LMG 10767 / O) TaxID=760192 RepID=F4KT36_HALH1|nr:hypothetical protein Halhy_2224 [Haliscomenobacter hydrossis DSM 1100]
MRENRTYGLTRGRSGSAASLYSTGAIIRGEKICGAIIPGEHKIDYITISFGLSTLAVSAGLKSRSVLIFTDVG